MEALLPHLAHRTVLGLFLTIQKTIFTLLQRVSTQVRLAKTF